jgi:hypothetical protein
MYDSPGDPCNTHSDLVGVEWDLRMCFLAGSWVMLMLLACRQHHEVAGSGPFYVVGKKTNKKPEISSWKIFIFLKIFL